MIKDFKGWISEKQNFSNAENAEIPWATEKTKKILSESSIDEGKMSEIDIMVQQSSSLEEFIKAVKEWSKQIKVDLDNKDVEWFKAIYDDFKSYHEDKE